MRRGSYPEARIAGLAALVLGLILLLGCSLSRFAGESRQRTVRLITVTATLTSTPTATATSLSPSLASPSPTPAPTHTSTLTYVQNEIVPQTQTPRAAPSSPAAPSAPVRPPAPTAAPVRNRTVRIGLHGRNDAVFYDMDYRLIQETGIETLKMLSVTDPEVFGRLKHENPNIELIVRLLDDRINAGGHPTPQEFAAHVIPIMAELRPYVTKFEIGNEPNHALRLEGWGSYDEDAASFNLWFLAVYDLLTDAHPWASLGFPALATPDSLHRYRAWLKLNQEAINRADWLGVHCYWHTAPDGNTTMFDPDFGLCFNYYHELFPDKPLELTEFGNDNPFYGLPPISEEQMAREHVAYFQELFKYPYLRSASSFILSSPYGQHWTGFVWRTEDGHIKSVAAAVRDMPRPTLTR